MLESIRKKILLQYLICYYLLLSRTTSMFARCPKLKTVQAFEIYLLILRFFGSLSQNMKDFQIVIGRSGSQLHFPHWEKQKFTFYLTRGKSCQFTRKETRLIFLPQNPFVPMVQLLRRRTPVQGVGSSNPPWARNFFFSFFTPVVPFVRA